MSTLHIFDSSQYVYAGRPIQYTDGIVESNGSYKSRGIEIGGVRNLLKTIGEFDKRDATLVYCFDRIPSYRRNLHKEIYPNGTGYKGNRRVQDTSVYYQRDVAEELLGALGFNTVAVEAAEADDCIAAVVKYYKTRFDEVIVHSRDSDLVYLVDDNVSIGMVGKQGRIITKENYEDAALKEYILPYNTIWFHKLGKGDYSDNIPPIDAEVMQHIIKVFPADAYAECGDPDFMRKAVNIMSHGNEVVMKTLDLILPMDLSEEEVFLEDKNIDRELYKYLSCEFGLDWYSKSGSFFLERGRDLLQSLLDRYSEE